MSMIFKALPSDAVARVREGGPDANGQRAERRVSDGDGCPCRCCLSDIPRGQDMLVLAWRPFPAPQPYAETGPIFLCAACARRPDGPDLPPIVAARRRFMVRGYGPDHRIAEGSGGVVATPALASTCAALLARPEIAYVHLRSAVNGCYQVRVEWG